MSRFVVLLFLINLAIIKGAAILGPKKENPFYNALEEKCPYIGKLKDFKTQEVFGNCTDWNKINAIQKLSKDNEKDFLCLLYFDSFNMFCSELDKQVTMLQQKTVNISRTYFIPTPQVLSKTVDDICKNLTVFPSNKNFEHNITKILERDSQCFKICATYEGLPVPECSLAHYFATLDVPQLMPKNKPIEAKAADVPNMGNVEPKPSQVQSNSANAEHNLSSTVVEEKLPQNTAERQPGKAIATDQLGSELDKTGKSKIEAQNKGGKPEEAPKAVPAKAPEPPKAPLPVKPELVPVQSPDQNQAVSSEVIPPHPEVPKPDNTEETPQIEGENPGGSKAVQGDETGNRPDIELDINNKGEPEIELEHPESVLPNPDAESDAGELMPPDPDDLGDDDEDQEEKKEEEMGEKVEQPKKQEIKIDAEPAQEINKENSNTMEVMPGNIPINSANAGDIDGESYFFSYFMAICVLFVLGYVGYHNRQKVMALVVEGKRGKRQFRGRRPNSANYHKLDSNLEEAISSTCTKNASHVIY